MFIANPESIKLIRDNLPNAEELLNAEDLDLLLGELDGFIATYGFDRNDDITDFGWELTKAYDDFYYHNP